MHSSIQYKLSDSDAELTQILSLQQSNLPQNISLQEKATQGFVTVKHDLELLQLMQTKLPHTIAKVGDRVIAYALSMHPELGDAIPVLRPLFAQIKAHLADEQSYMVMGQVCVAKDYRGRGVFRKLYQTLIESYQGQFDHLITEIHSDNVRSLNAHQAIGFSDLLQHTETDGTWHIVTKPL